MFEQRAKRVPLLDVAVAQLGPCPSGENAEPREGVLRASATSSRPIARRETGLGDAPRRSYATATDDLATIGAMRIGVSFR
jgi:hypothetical protein